MPYDTLPKQGMDVPVDAIKLKRDEYTARLPYWEFFRHSDELTGGYAASTQDFTGSKDDLDTYDSTYLLPHEKEDDYDFQRRVATAQPPRFVQEGITSIVGVLTQKEPDRSKYPTKLAEWTTKVNAEGMTWQQLIATRIAPLVERYGIVYGMARAPDIFAETEFEAAKQRKEKNLPQFEYVLLNPENVPWWETDTSGNLISLRYFEDRIETKYDDTGTFALKRVKVRRHWWISKRGWYYCDEPKEESDKPGMLTVLGVGPWKTGGKPMTYFPVSKWHLKADVSPTDVAAFAQLAYFRKESELSNLETATCFPMTCIPIGAKDINPAETVKGPSVVLTFSEDANHVPFILQPDSGPFTHFNDKRLPALEEAAMAPYGRRRQHGADDSGRALAHMEQQATNIYKQHSKAFSASEFNAVQPIAEMLQEKMPFDARADWPTDFSMISGAEHMTEIVDYCSLSPGDEFKKIAIQEGARIIKPGISDDEMTKGVDALEKETQEQKQRESDFDDLRYDTDNKGQPDSKPVKPPKK